MGLETLEEAVGFKALNLINFLLSVGLKALWTTYFPTQAMSINYSVYIYKQGRHNVKC